MRDVHEIMMQKGGARGAFRRHSSPRVQQRSWFVSHSMFFSRGSRNASHARDEWKSWPSLNHWNARRTCCRRASWTSETPSGHATSPCTYGKRTGYATLAQRIPLFPIWSEYLDTFISKAHCLFLSLSVSLARSWFTSLFIRKLKVCNLCNHNDFSAR